MKDDMLRRPYFKRISTLRPLSG